MQQQQQQQQQQQEIRTSTHVSLHEREREREREIAPCRVHIIFKGCQEKIKYILRVGTSRVCVLSRQDSSRRQSNGGRSMR